MKRYTVILRRADFANVEINAKNQREAEEKADKLADYEYDGPWDAGGEAPTVYDVKEVK